MKIEKIICAFAVLYCLIANPVCAAKVNDLETGFRNPPHSAGIRCYWWWLNGNVTEEAITRDLEEMKAKGYSGALIFDADGSAQQSNRRVPAGPVFGGPEWTKLFVHACKKAKRLDLELSLNIQSGWNLGGPKVTEEEATQRLVWSKTDVKGPATIEQVLKSPARPGRFYKDVAVIAIPIPAMPAVATVYPIKDLELKSSTRELGMSAPDSRFLLDTSPALPGELAVKSKDIIDLTTKMDKDKDGTLRWDVPRGEWVVLRIGHTPAGAHVSTQSAGWAGLVLDYMNPDSLRAYWQRNIEPLCDAIGPLAGTALRYLHTDSWEGGGMNWTPGFDQTFKKNRGYDLLPWLPVLAGYVVDSREDSNAFLADFRKTIGDRVAGHYALLAELARKHGMGTHPECSGPHAGPLDGLKDYGRSELMMSEFWSPSGHRPKPADRFFVKQASSAAHTYGKRLVGAEGFTTIGLHWNDVPWSAMKPSFDYAFCEGLNLVFTHTFTCSPKEMGIPGQEYFAGTHFNPQITWWDEAPAFINYLKRCQYLAQQGDFVADVVYYYGDHIPNIARLKADDPAGALPGFDYDVLSEELLLSSLTVKDGILTLPSGMKYRVLALPNHRVLSLAALKKVDALVCDGATVLGLKPLRMVSLAGGDAGKAMFKKLTDDLWGSENQADGQKGIRKLGKGRVAWGTTAREFLLSDGVAQDVAFQDKASVAGMAWIHYRIAEADVYFLAEQTGEGMKDTAIFRCAGRVPELWNAADGTMREAHSFRFVDGRTHVPLEFDPCGSILVVFRKPAAGGRNDGANFPAWREKQSISGPWDVTFDAKWGGPKQPVRFDTLTSWTDHGDPGIKHYSGKAVYRTTFNIGNDMAGKPLAIELGQVLDVGIAGVSLNGTDLGVVWQPPFRVDVTKAVRAGENKLEVMVVNSWRNRLIGDQNLPEDKRLTRTNISVTKTWKLETSGLLGPVRLMERLIAPQSSPQTAQKSLPIKGEVFTIEGRTAFLILPKKNTSGTPIPWVWYAPTLPGLPGKAETWMFEKFLDNGIAIAGVDVGESYGSPKGRAIYSALYKELVEKRGLAKRACLLARSRGGLMLYDWAAENPKSVACIAGIYPVCNLSSYPGLGRACGAYGMTEEQLAAQLAEHNPIDRLAPLAKAKVPIFHIHGDNDKTVPLDSNSGELKKRYDALGGEMTLEIVKGQGHNMWSGWFTSQKLADFVIAHAREDKPNKAGEKR